MTACDLESLFPVGRRSRLQLSNGESPANVETHDIHPKEADQKEVMNGRRDEEANRMRAGVREARHESQLREKKSDRQSQ